MTATAKRNTLSGMPNRKPDAKMSGADLKALIESYGKTQNEFAELMGVSYVTVSRWATGRSTITEKHVLLIQKRLKAWKKPRK